MANENNESKKLMLGLLIGGVIGAGALYLLNTAQSHKTPVLKKIGKTISDVGEMLEHCNFDVSGDVVQSIENSLPKGADVLNNVMEWVDTGMSLWKKFKKG